MIIRFKRRESRKSKKKNSSSRTTWCSVRVAVYFVAFVGTLYLVTAGHGLDNHFARIAADAIFHLPQNVISVVDDHPTIGSTREQPPQQAQALAPPIANSTATTNREPTTEQQNAGPALSVDVSPRIKDSMLQVGARITAEAVWTSILQEGEALLTASATNNNKRKDLVAIEVGMHRAHQCVQAATLGLTAHCLEPSPQNFERVLSGLQKSPPRIQNRIQLYQMAAGATSGNLLNFTAAGGTGDHVGEFDPWNMKIGKPTDEALREKVGSTVQVESVALDDIIEKALADKSPEDDNNIFVLKVDTQGFEPSVFAGLNASVFQRPRIDYILFEYWPKGMDLLASTPGQQQGTDVTRKCIAANLLERLQQAGYTLFALPNTGHYYAPHQAKVALREERAPLDNPRNNCDYYYQLEERFPSSTYKMGYWSDFLAVAPNASLPAFPVTGVGKALQKQQQQPQALS